MEPALHVGDSHPVYTEEKFEVNDIVVYMLGFEDLNIEKTTYCHRLVGVPGDTLEMIAGSVKVNGAEYKNEPELKHSYVVTTSTQLNKRWLDQFEYTPRGLDQYLFHSTEKEIKAVAKNSAVVSIESQILDHDDISETTLLVVPGNNRDNWGPFRVPKKGDVVTLTERTLKLYSPVLKADEKTLTVGRSYTIPIDCYFVLGDNRHNALDSRFMGLIRADDMRGVMVP